MLSLLLFTLCPYIALGASYNYDRCDFTYGPSAWTDPYCGDTQTKGTPIDLCGAVAFSTNPTMEVQNYDVARTMQIINNGHTIQVTIQSSDSTRPWLQVGNLSAIVGQSTNATTQTWMLQQMHLHWGRMNMTNEGSEHFMQGMQYAAEAHFVHYNSRFGSFSNAVASGESDGLLVVGVFLEYGDTDDSETVTTIGNYYNTATGTNTNMQDQLTLSNLFDGTGDFYSYAGGLTTPGCNEIVTWVVMTETKKITNATLMNYWMIPEVPGTPADGYISHFGNWRPLQLLNGRTVYNTAGSTAACTTTSQPRFNCSAGLTTVADTKTYIGEKYQQTVFTYQGVTSMTEAARFNLAFALVYTEIIALSTAIFGYLLVTAEEFTLPLIAASKGSASEIMVTDFGSAVKAVFMSYSSDSTGFTSMDIPFNNSNSWWFLFSVDRMDNEGNLVNEQPMTFTVEIEGTDAGLKVLTYNDEHPDGKDVTVDGGSVTYLGFWKWQVTVNHTSAIAGYTEGSTAPSGGTTKNNDGLLGLIALIFLPCIAIPICFWGWKQGSKASKAPVGGYEEGAVVPSQSYPYGMPSSPMGMNPYYAKPLEMSSYSVPAFAPSYPAPMYP